MMNIHATNKAALEELRARHSELIKAYYYRCEGVLENALLFDEDFAPGWNDLTAERTTANFRWLRLQRGTIHDIFAGTTGYSRKRYSRFSFDLGTKLYMRPPGLDSREAWTYVNDAIVKLIYAAPNTVRYVRLFVYTNPYRDSTTHIYLLAHGISAWANEVSTFVMSYAPVECMWLRTANYDFSQFPLGDLSNSF